MLDTCLLNRIMNLLKLTELIGINTCLLNSLFVVILNLGFSFFGLFIIFYISSNFFVEMLKKISLIFTISLILAEDTWIYE